MRLTSAGYCIPVAKCEPLLPSTAAPAKLRQSLPKRGIQIRGVFFSILRRMRRAHSQIAASAVRQHGNPEASRFFRKSRPKKIFIRAATYPYPLASVRTRSIGLYMLPNPNNSLIRFCKRRLSRHNHRWRFRARRVRCGSFFAELRALLFLR